MLNAMHELLQRVRPSWARRRDVPRALLQELRNRVQKVEENFHNIKILVMSHNQRMDVVEAFHRGCKVIDLIFLEKKLSYWNF